MESLLHYTWKHRMFPLGALHTTDGRRIDVLSTGIHNMDAGPDFTCAHIRIDDVEWVGNVEIHLRSSDWYRHHHDSDPAYDGVVLHVVSEADAEVMTHSGIILPQLILQVPPIVSANYESLRQSDCHPRCKSILQTVPQVAITSWLSALSIERLEQRMSQLMERREQCGLSWETTAFVTIARNFGFGKNGDTLERWALSVPESAMHKHRDSLFQIETLFFGMSGLLDVQAEGVEYYSRLQTEWRYLSHKFSLNGLDPTAWKLLRMRPQNFPYTRLAQLAMLYHRGTLNLSRILNATSVDEMMHLLDTSVSQFWQTHYTFTSSPSRSRDGNLSDGSKRLIILNSIVPLLFAYGKYKSDEQLKERAIRLLEELPPESNTIVRSWNDAGIMCRSAAESQALFWLTTRYCEHKDCMRCRFGHEYMSQNPRFLQENAEDKD